MSIADRRRALGYSQAFIAKELGIDQTAVHCWEVGKTKPRADKLPQLAKLLQCSIDELLQYQPQADTETVSHNLSQ